MPKPGDKFILCQDSNIVFTIDSISDINIVTGRCIVNGKSLSVYKNIRDIILMEAEIKDYGMMKEDVVELKVGDKFKVHDYGVYIYSITSIEGDDIWGRGETGICMKCRRNEVVLIKEPNLKIGDKFKISAYGCFTYTVKEFDEKMVVGEVNEDEHLFEIKVRIKDIVLVNNNLSCAKKIINETVDNSVKIPQNGYGKQELAIN